MKTNDPNEKSKQKNNDEDLDSCYDDDEWQDLSGKANEGKK
jgi:hypothetical protein